MPKSRHNHTKPRPLPPRLVLFLGFLIPCIGHFLNRMPGRMGVFLGFAIFLGWISLNLIPESVCVARHYPRWRCFFVQHIGLFFIWWVAAVDAYMWAKIREVEYESHRQHNSSTT